MIPKAKKNISPIVFFIVYLGLYCAGFVFTVIFPFASEMIMSFGMTSNKDATGYWVGLLATSLMLGRLISSPIWGHLIDTWGRKPVTQLSLASMCLLSITFGLSPSMLWALAFRLLLGLLSPTSISAKTMVSDLLEGEDISSAMAWICISWNIGSISGSFFGGIFSNKTVMEYIPGTLFTDYPYLLANLFPAIVSAIALVLGHFYLPETLVKTSDTETQVSNKSIREIIMTPRVFSILVPYIAISFSFTAFQEVITLFSWATTESGGLELSTTGIGLLLGCSNIFLLFFQKQLYMYMVRKIGNIASCRLCLMCIPVITAMIPLTSLIRNTYMQASLLFVLCVLWFLFDFIASTATSVLINNSVHPSEIGRVNGATMSISCMTRFVAPGLMGATFAWTIESFLPQPLNSSFAFYVLSAVYCVGLMYSYKIDKSCEGSYEKQSSEIALIDIYEEEIKAI